MSEDDETKRLLEQLMQELHAQQSKSGGKPGRTYLEANDGTFLGNVDSNRYDRDSLLNQYGPYGSKYSQTSIHNPYSPFGSPYGAHSIRNPATFTPPKLYINGEYAGRVSTNPRVAEYIPAQDFLDALSTDIRTILDRTFLRNGAAGRQARKESYLQATDGTYLGSLNPNNFDQNSIFNQFGPYGSQFSPTSIYNQFGPYGGQFSQMSPFNKFSNSGPIVFLNGNRIGTLTANPFTPNRIDPDTIKEWAHRNVHRTLI
jgi:hypothetical protein